MLNMPRNPSLHGHILPWRILPHDSYRYDNPKFGVHSQPFAFAADVAARIPISSESIYIIGDAEDLCTGLISFTEDDGEGDMLPSNKLQVNLRIYSHTHEMIHATDVSYVRSHQGDIGLRIHVS